MKSQLILVYNPNFHSSSTAAKLLIYTGRPVSGD